MEKKKGRRHKCGTVFGYSYGKVKTVNPTTDVGSLSLLTLILQRPPAMCKLIRTMSRIKNISQCSPLAATRMTASNCQTTSNDLSDEQPSGAIPYILYSAAIQVVELGSESRASSRS
jgi:hypothetical protein